MKTLLIINPRSGTSTAKTTIAQLAQNLLTPPNYDLHIVFTEYAGHASDLASEASRQDYDIVIACGGDGTINEVAAALCDSTTALGIIPCGSGNGLARHLNIPLNPDAALQIIADGNNFMIDCCTANGKPFFCTFGMGFDADVADRFNSRPDQRGLVNYLRAAVEEMAQFRSTVYTISTDSETLTERAFLIACCNASQYGNNAFIAPNATMADGLMDITVIHSGNWLSRVLAGIQVIAGTMRNSPIATTFQARSVTISRPTPGPVHIDGDPIDMGTNVIVECHHRALRVISPGEVKVQPLLTPLGLKLPPPIPIL